MNYPPPRFVPHISHNPPYPPGPCTPPPPNPLYYYPQLPPPSLPNVNVPPPTYMYPEGAPMYPQYYHQGGDSGHLTKFECDEQKIITYGAFHAI
ncbi:hypothetical protein NQ318_003845 [Aromia moschata]|uniref:Uncharacterized protein n=1 Tax=Aromia moschata TaxID=1265417 RepID=A0AAV8Z9I6_9CUCU|nr:hypothetical protein NQ318_003845 [Aromia moschata]